MSLLNRVRNKAVRSIDPNSPNALRQVVEMLEVFAGIRGDKNERRPSVAELKKMLQDGSLAEFGAGSAGGGGGSGGSGGGSGSQIIPTAPRDINATIAIENIALRWGKPSYQGHGFTEVWRSTSDSLTSASLIGVSGGTVFSDYRVLPDTQYYYFLRNVVSPSFGKQSSPFANAIPVKSHKSEPLPSDVLIDANDHTDQQLEQLDISLQNYANNAASTAESNANDHTNQSVDTLNTDLRSYVDDQLLSLVAVLENELQITIPWPPSP